MDNILNMYTVKKMASRCRTETTTGGFLPVL